MRLHSNPVFLRQLGLIQDIFGPNSLSFSGSKAQSDFLAIMEGKKIPLEYKTKETLPPKWVSLVQQYQNSGGKGETTSKPIRLIRQIISSMDDFNVRYGVLSCYEVTYLFKIRGDTLLVSDRIPKEDGMEALACFLSLTPGDVDLGCQEGQEDQEDQEGGQKSEGVSSG